MGLTPVAHIDGGFTGWKGADAPDYYAGGLEGSPEEVTSQSSDETPVSSLDWLLKLRLGSKSSPSSLNLL